MKEEIGLKDRDGSPIREGDIVEYVIAYDYSHPPVPTYDSPTGTRRVEIVRLMDGEYYFCNDTFGSSAYASEHNEQCKIMGNIHDGCSVASLVNKRAFPPTSHTK